MVGYIAKSIFNLYFKISYPIANQINFPDEKKGAVDNKIVSHTEQTRLIASN